VIGRAEATRAVQQSLAEKWVWQDKTGDGWATDLAAVQAKQARLLGLEQDAARARAEADAAVKDLHNRTVQGLGMARARYRKDPATLGALAAVDAKMESRQDALNDALAWETAWANVPEADWDPTPTNTRAAFAALRQAAQAKVQALNDLVADERQVRKEFNQLVGELWEDCIAWYEAACLVFPADTPEGQALRAGVPAAGSRKPPTPPAPAAP